MIDETKKCIYCDEQKQSSEFSLEHIWPDGLGGDYLSKFWRTRDVCRKCNSISGVFVDGAFIKQHLVAAERMLDGLEYLSSESSTGTIQLGFCGTVQNIEAPDGEVVDFWVCAPGANVLHFRAKSEITFDTYVGGDPRRSSKRSKAGRVVVSFTTEEPFWIEVALRSVKRHFSKAPLFVETPGWPDEHEGFLALSPENPEHAFDLDAVRKLYHHIDAGGQIHAQIAHLLHADARFMSKLALAVGYKIFGESFMVSDDARLHRKSFREADPLKREKLKIKGSGLLTEDNSPELSELLKWPGAWQLLLQQVNGALALVVTTPSGRKMVVQITDDRELLEQLDHDYREGKHWLAVPQVQKGVGPTPYPKYLAHILGSQSLVELEELAALRTDPSTLPSANI
ncbi:MAG: HNH endonuclease [Litoreibacter sp.]